MTGSDPLRGWIPCFIGPGPDGAVVEWAYMGERRFTEPFYQQSVAQLMSRPFNQAFRRRTPLRELPELARQRPGLAPAGFIFHMTRCGSTLVAQALASLADTVVLSEPEPLDTLLGLLHRHQDLTREDRIAQVKGLIAALGQPRRAGDRRLFVKFDAWHLVWANLLLDSFPGTPWIFVQRDPVEVMVSQQRLPGMPVIPGALPPDLGLAGELPCLDPMEHGARVIARVLNEALGAFERHPGGLLMDYRELPEVLESRLAVHFGLRFSPSDLAAMRSVYQRDAKQPRQPFTDDSAEKRAAADDRIIALVSQWLAEPYQRLEALRRNADP